MKNILKKVIAIVLTLSTLLTLCSCGAIGRTKVDIKDYVEVEFDGLNGYATASLNVDYDRLNDLVAEDMQKFVSKITKDNGELLLFGLYDISNYIKIDFKEDYSNLSNGDTVTVTVSAQEETLKLFGIDYKDVEKGLGIKFVDTEVSFKVEGLQDGIFIDIFEGIEEYISYKYMGSVGDMVIEGEAHPSVIFPKDYTKQIGDLYFVRDSWYSNVLDVIYNNQTIAEIKYNRVYDTKNEDEFYLDGGEEFVISVSGYSDLEEYNFVCENSKTFVVPALCTRVTSMEQISAKEIQQIKNDITTQCTEEKGKVLEVKYLYYGTRKATSVSGKANVVLAAVNIEDDWFGSRGVYVWVDLLRTPEGKLVVDAYSYGTAYEGIEEKINNDENYTFKSML